MQVSCSIMAARLTLGDVRRLFRETGGWSNDCRVQLESGATRDRITVVELDEDRNPRNRTGELAP